MAGRPTRPADAVLLPPVQPRIPPESSPYARLRLEAIAAEGFGGTPARIGSDPNLEFV